MAVDKSGINNGFYGKKHTPESKEKMRLRKLGKKFSEEHKKNLRKHLGERSPWWKGDGVSYRSLHRWVERWLGKAKKCMKDQKHKSTRYHWANISKEYKRDLTDLIQLCPSCNCKDRIGRRVSS